MIRIKPGLGLLAAGAVAIFLTVSFSPTAFAQQDTTEQSAATDQPPPPMSEDDLEILVARIALYPDELVAVISSASLYPLQIVEAQRFLDDLKSNASLQPRDSWDGSVVSLLNYPEIVKMMATDLDWTQQLATALAYQQEDVLTAIQTLRQKAVDEGVIKSDDKIKVTNDNSNVVIQSATPDTIYVPRYEPQMLYEPNYHYVPIGYYPDPYPPYYYPTAPFFAGLVTGVVWGATVDWDRHGVWGGPWRGDVDIDCNNCFNNKDFNGKVNINDVDWKHVDRNKINIDKSQFNKIDNNNFRSNIEKNTNTNIGNKAATIKRTNVQTKTRAGNNGITKSDLNKNKPDLKKPSQLQSSKPSFSKPSVSKPEMKNPGLNKPAAKKPEINKPAAKVQKPSARPKAPAKAGKITKKPSVGGGARKPAGGAKARKPKKPQRR